MGEMLREDFIIHCVLKGQDGSVSFLFIDFLSKVLSDPQTILNDSKSKLYDNDKN